MSLVLKKWVDDQDVGQDTQDVRDDQDVDDQDGDDQYGDDQDVGLNNHLKFNMTQDAAKIWG